MSEQRKVSGVGLVEIVGMILAALCSWQLNHSLFWVVIHCLFGWFYILYLCAGCGGGLPV